MIKFDSTHKKLNKPIKKENGKNAKNIILSGLLVSCIFLSGCGHNCDIKDLHVHKYVDENTGFVLYTSKEQDKIWFPTGIFANDTTAYKIVTEEEKEYYDFMANNQLIKIEDNNEKIIEFLSQNGIKSYYQYEYYDNDPLPMPDGTIIPFPSNKWTTNPTRVSRSLTGRIRVVQPVYYGFNIEHDQNNRLVLVKSEPFNTYEELIAAGYKYISSSIQNFTYLLINANTIEENEQKKY